MSAGRVKNTELSAIAAAIRSKNGSSTAYKPSEMAQAILDIPTGGSAVIESKNITANGTYTAPTGVDGYSPVTVSVQPNLQSKTATENGTVTPDSGYDGLSSVVVNVSGGGGGFDDYHIASQYDSGGPVFYSEIASPNRGGSAPSGTFGLVYFGPVDLTTKSTASIVVSLRDSETNTSNGMIFGVNSTLPESWSDANSVSGKQVISSTGTITIDVSDLSGNYYLFYATVLTYNSYGWCILAFKFEI